MSEEDEDEDEEEEGIDGVERTIAFQILVPIVLLLVRLFLPCGFLGAFS